MELNRLGYVDAIISAAAAHPDRQASCCADRTLSWGEMLMRAGRIAGGLRDMGVQPGDRVAVLSANSDHYMALYLAIPWAGGVIVPLNVRWSAAENSFALADCTPKVVFVENPADEATAALFERRSDMAVIALDGSAGPDRPSLDDMMSPEPIANIGRAGDDLFGIFYTGGTTGRSKGVMLSHAGFTSNSIAMRAQGLFPEGCRALVVAPLFHLAAIAELTMIMLAGGTAIIAPSFDPARTLDLIESQSVTDALLVPTMIQMLLDAPAFDPARLSSFKRVLYGASPMPEATLDRIMAAAPHIDFYQAYGMTELSCTATLLPPDHHRGAHRQAGRHRGAGMPIATAQIMIADEQDAPLAAGEVGQILVRGAGVMLGYWNQPDLTADTVRDGWMHTGDGGRIDDHGVLYVVDRIKDMIVSGGENVYSAEVESVITRHPDVAQGAVIGVPDACWGERVHAVIVPRPGHSLSPESVIDHCRTLIAGYKCPRSVEFRAALPLSPAGKILKTELRKPYWEGRSRNVA